MPEGIVSSRQNAAGKHSVASLLAALSLALALGGPSVYAAGSPPSPSAVAENMPGFLPYMSYQDFGHGESVNLSNLGLTIAHPSAISYPEHMGGALRITRYYNSQSTISAYDDLPGPGEKPDGVLGKGWTISVGRVFLRMASYPSGTTAHNNVDFFFADETGAEHRLFLKDTTQPLGQYGQYPATGWYFTNDGSFLRAYYVDKSNPSDPNCNLWFIYFPDGSIRVAGGTENSAYVPPVPAGNPTNAYTHGWYVTEIMDRAGNKLTVQYRTCNTNAGSFYQPYAGAIASISDSYSPARTLTFHYNTDTSNQFEFNLLTSITADTRTENYFYTQVNFPTDTIFPTHNELVRVEDPEHMETTYAYTFLQDPTQTTPKNPHLTAIGYPTGAVSQYGYNYVSSSNPIRDQLSFHELDIHALNVDDPSGNANNHLLWTYTRYTNALAYFGRAPTCALVVKDPLGTQEVHFLLSDITSKFPGEELTVLKLQPGAANFNPTNSNPTAGRIWQRDVWYAHGPSSTVDSDDKHCKDDDGGGTIPHANPRIRRTMEAEYATTGSWQKTTESYGWDGFGHYRVTYVTGTPAITPNATVVAMGTYDLQNSLGSPADPRAVRYQLDRPLASYAGSFTSAAPTATQGDVEDPTPPASWSASGGSYKATVAEYAGDSLALGLPSTVTAYQSAQTQSISVASTTLALAPSAQTGTAFTTSITYSAGDVASLISSGPTGNTYAQSYAWEAGTLKTKSWTDTENAVHQEFTREMYTDNTGRIHYQTDINGLVTTFEYDDLGRIKKIASPGENATLVDYPRETYSDSIMNMDRNVGHAIRYYKGTGTSVPSDISSLDPQDVFTIYTFDDLGRQWKTDSVMPDGSWSESETFYDALGRQVFTSEAYTPASSPLLMTSNPPVAAGSSFSFKVPGKNFSLNGGAAADHPYGTWNSLYDGATLNFPYTGTPEALYRTLRTIKSDGSYTSMVYDGLLSWVTVHGIQLSATTTGDAQTKYTKDVMGRLVAVTPPTGVTAASGVYGYDALGNLISVNLNGQVRTFTYDALGHVLSAANPESGTVNSMTYDALGNLLGYTDNRSQAFVLAYDYKGRIRTKALSGQTDALITWNYDESTDSNSAYLGHLTSTITTSASELYSYSQTDGRLSKKQVSIYTSATDTSPLTYPISYSYDPMGNLASERVTLSNGDGRVIQTDSTYTHGFLTTKTFGGSSTTQDGVGKGETLPLTYYPSGALAAMPYSNGTVATFTLDDAMARLKKIEVAGGGFPVGSPFAIGPYGYDGAGNIKSIGADSFLYDLVGRLTQANVSHEGNSVTLSYTYDAWGNIRTRTPSNYAWMSGSAADFLSKAQFSATYPQTADYPGSANKIQTLTHGNTPTTVGYDGNGNLTSAGTATYTYDPLNQQVKAVISGLPSTSANEEDYGYDAAGERVVTTTAALSALAPKRRTYFIRSGGQVLAEESFVQQGGTTTSHTRKGYLYVGSRLVTSEQWQLAASGTGGGGTGSNTTLRSICPKDYAANAGVTALPALSEPQVQPVNPNTQIYESDYNVLNVGPDVVGLVVRIARIKIPGGPGSTDPGNGTRRDDEDYANCAFFLQSGLDPDFVFARYGLKSTASYGTITALQQGSPITVACPQLQTSQSYRFTLAIWTSVGADTDLGYQFVLIEEGQLTVPQSYATSHLSVMGRAMPGSDGQLDGKYHVSWSAPGIQNITGYNLLATLADGSTMTLNDTPIQTTTWDMDAATIESLGVEDGTAVTLQALQGTTASPISKTGGGDLKGCPGGGGGGTPAPCVPTGLKAINLSGGGTSRIYLTWTPCSQAVSGYRIYRAAGTSVTYSFLASTTNPSYMDLAVDGSSAYSYKVQSVGTDGVTLSSLCFQISLNMSSTQGVPTPSNLRAVNTSTGDPSSRGVRLTWQWSGGTLPADFYYVINRAYNIQAANCAGVQQASYIQLATGTDPTYDDAGFDATPNPLVAYEVAIGYSSVGVVSAFSACSLTQVDACAALPMTPVNPSGTFNETTWAADLTWTPPSDAGAWTSYEVYTAYQPIGGGILWGATTGTTFSVSGQAFPGGSDVVFYVLALDSRTGCRSLAAQALVSFEEQPCISPPAVPVLQTPVVAVETITLTWATVANATQYTIRRGHGSCGSPMADYATVTVPDPVPATLTFQDTAAPGTTLCYAVVAVAGDASCASAPSNCMAVSIPLTPGAQDALAYFYVTDHLGTVRLVTDSYGTLVSHHDCEPYGVEIPPVMPAGNVSVNTHEFTGQERDFFSGNDYMHYRFYASTMGRFMKPDNIMGSVANPQSWNLYAYVGDNPVDRNDPSGHDWGSARLPLRNTFQAGMFSYDSAISSLVGKSLSDLTITQLIEAIRQAYGVPDSINIDPIPGFQAQALGNTIQLPQSQIQAWGSGPTTTAAGPLVASLLMEWGNVSVGNTSHANHGESPANKEAFAYVWALNKAQRLGILGSPSSWALISGAITTMIQAEYSFKPEWSGLTFKERQQVFLTTPGLIKEAFGMHWVPDFGYAFGPGVQINMSPYTVEDYLKNIISFGP